MTDFETYRPHLVALAYRILGSATEAEDMAQEAYLRARAMPEAVASPKAWLTAVVTRLCLDHLKSARSRRETYEGPWLPEPVSTDDGVDRESISLAFLVLLESLSPVERAVYVLHEAFDYSHAEIAEIIEKDEATCRQILRRARQHVAERKPRFAPSKDAHQAMLSRFMAACMTGDLEGLRGMLAADATLWSDGGGKAKAATRPVHSADHVARWILGVMRKASPDLTVDVADVNGWPALLSRVGGQSQGVLTIETDGETIYAIRMVVNPDKLNHV